MPSAQQRQACPHPQVCAHLLRKGKPCTHKRLRTEPKLEAAPVLEGASALLPRDGFVQNVVFLQILDTLTFSLRKFSKLCSVQQNKIHKRQHVGIGPKPWFNVKYLITVSGPCQGVLTIFQFNPAQNLREKLCQENDKETEGRSGVFVKSQKFDGQESRGQRDNMKPFLFKL